MIRETDKHFTSTTELADSGIHLDEGGGGHSDLDGHSDLGGLSDFGVHSTLGVHSNLGNLSDLGVSDFLRGAGFRFR